MALRIDAIDATCHNHKGTSVSLCNIKRELAHINYPGPKVIVKSLLNFNVAIIRDGYSP